MRWSSILGTVGLLGFGLQVLGLRGLEWGDAYIASLAADLRGCEPADAVAHLTRLTPWVGAALVATGLSLALVRRARLADVVWTLALFGFGLLLVEACKVIFDRARPGAPAWLPEGDSFPSGHVADAVLFAMAAVGLASGRTTAAWQHAVRLALASAGPVFVSAVALTRLYLGRHWLSDVTGSVLLCMSWFCLTFSCRTAAMRWCVGVLAVVVISGIYLASAVGARIPLPSPSTLSGASQFRLPLRNAHARAAAGLGGKWVPRRWARGYLRLNAVDVRLRVRLAHGERSVLKLVARPLRGLLRTACPRIQLLVDGHTIGTQPLVWHWRAYTFAVPVLSAGPHEVRLRIVEETLRFPGAPVLAVRHFRID